MNRRQRQSNTLIVSTPTTKGLASKILSFSKSPDFKEGVISWNTFEDGFPNLMIEDIEEFRGSDVVFIADFLSLEAIFAQLAVIYALPRYFVRSLMVVLPYFPTGTMEKVNTEGQVATAYTLSTILSAIPLTSSGPAKLVIYDIHALQQRFYFHNSVIPILESAIPIFKSKLKESHADEKICIAFPDEGAKKRFNSYFKDIPIVFCIKTRDENERKVEIAEGDVKGYHVFIVDDLVKTGGTLLECKKTLFKNGAAKVSAFVSHAVFPQLSWKKFVDDDEPFTHFYTTDSCPTVTDVIKDHKPFEILSLGESLYECIVNYSDN